MSFTVVFDLTGCCFPTALTFLSDTGQLLVENYPKIYCSVQLCKKDQKGLFDKKSEKFLSSKIDFQVLPPLRRLMFLTSEFWLFGIEMLCQTCETILNEIK